MTKNVGLKDIMLTLKCIHCTMSFGELRSVKCNLVIGFKMKN